VTQTEATRTRSGWPGFAMAVLFLLASLVLHRHFFHDDAYIVLRYAQRWLAGQGLTWNAGERVEGFSSPFWLVQVALLGRLGLALPFAARVLGLAYAVATVLLWYRARAAPAGLLALVTVPGFAMWSWGGLETLCACFWMLWALYLVWPGRDEPWPRTRSALLAFALAAVALGRPEGPAVALAICAVAWPARSRSLLLAALAAGVAFASYECFRLLYFGDFIANAARAKALGLPVGARLEDAAVYVAKTSPQWLGSVLVATWLLGTSPARRRAAWLLLPALPLLAVVVVGGGDHMAGARLLVGVTAVACFAGALAPPSPRPWIRRSSLVLAALAALWQLQLSTRYPAGPNPAAALGEIVGQTLERRLPPGTVVASATAGSLPYFAPSLSFIDTLGLNDRHIARQPPAALPRGLPDADDWATVPGHVRGDGSYVLRRRPDVIILGGANGDIEPWFLGDYQLMMAESFRAAYAPWRLLAEVPSVAQPWLADELHASGRLPIVVYARRDSPAWAALSGQGEPVAPPWARAH
jgi:arabinofuranosyltransferase